MGNNPSVHRYGNHYPVDTVCWFDALLFCNRLSEKEGLVPAYELPEDSTYSSAENVQWNREAGGYRLPTSAEWEYAARAGSYALVSGSNKPAEAAWYQGNSQGKTHPVGHKKPNNWGLFDMSGNLWEWVFDGYDAKKKAQKEAMDPVSWRGNERIQRGGGFLSPLAKLDVAYCDRESAHFRSDDIGFRFVRNA